jgi:hypothetical protein
MPEDLVMPLAVVTLTLRGDPEPGTLDVGQVFFPGGKGEVRGEPAGDLAPERAVDPKGSVVLLGLGRHSFVEQKIRKCKENRVDPPCGGVEFPLEVHRDPSGVPPVQQGVILTVHSHEAPVPGGADPPDAAVHHCVEVAGGEFSQEVGPVHVDVGEPETVESPSVDPAPVRRTGVGPVEDLLLREVDDVLAQK